MDFKNAFFVLLNLALYGFAIYLYIEFLKVIKSLFLAKFTSGKLAFGEIVSIFAGIVLLGGAVVFGPQAFARAIGQGWQNFMGEMTIVTDQIVNDVGQLIQGSNPVYYRGSNPVYYRSESTLDSVPQSVPNSVPNQTFVIPGQDVGGGNPYGGDPNAGGGVGPVPEAIMPTPTPFNPGTWNPSDPPPTPMITRTVP